MIDRTQTFTVGVNRGADGKVPKRSRAAGLKKAVSRYTRLETVGLTASWDEDSATWTLVFKDESGDES